MAEQKAKVGRPSEYRKEFCQLAIDMGKEGRSFAQMAAAMGVSKQTAYAWVHEHPEFLDAIQTAKTLAQAWWERTGQDGLTNREINPGMYKIAMAARFPDDYSDRQKVELTGANGGAVQNEMTIKFVRPND